MWLFQILFKGTFQQDFWLPVCIHHSNLPGPLTSDHLPMGYNILILVRFCSVNKNFRKKPPTVLYCAEAVSPQHDTLQWQSPRSMILRWVSLPAAWYCAEAVSLQYHTGGSNSWPREVNSNFLKLLRSVTEINVYSYSTHKGLHFLCLQEQF